MTHSITELSQWAAELAHSGKAVIVEGPKDREALSCLGIKRIHMLHKKPVYELIEEVAACSKKVVILTDLDKEGKKLYHRISAGLQMHGVEVDNKFREWLFLNTRFRQIEGIRNVQPR